MPLNIGDTVADYEVLGFLGEGGMGKVYRVRNLISDREEALKILISDVDSSSDLAARFLREIKIQASLDHPHIAGLRTAFRANNQLMMIMELVDGINLQERIRRGPIEVRSSVNWIGQVFEALHYAHGRGVIHRDIKPSNIA